MEKLKHDAYDKLLEPLQIELTRMDRWLRATGGRIVVVFEGRDTAGKGGAIGAISQVLSPRQCRIAALGKPSERETGEWYFQRYVAHLPSAGEIVLFDRSWYNRAGVEKVMGFANQQQVAVFLKQAPVFEKQLLDDGILLFKYWLTTDQEHQENRLKERFEDPLKRWKLSPVDFAARAKYDDYTKAREAMLEATHTEYAPWTLVDFNDQKRGRLTLIRNLLDRLPDTEIAPEALEFGLLDHAPLKETFSVIEPIVPYAG